MSKQLQIRNSTAVSEFFSVTDNKSNYRGIFGSLMTYDEYIAQQQQAIDEEQLDDSCFLEYQPEGQFVRGH